MSVGPALEIAGLRRSFGPVEVLRGVSTQVARGEVRAIIGPNGAGKTTLINVMTGIHRASSGKVTLNGVEVTHLPPHQIARRGMIRTFQIASLFLELTVAENLDVAAFAARRFGTRRAETGIQESLEMMGLTHLATKRTAEISHGDQRLLEVAIATALQPELLLLDEPTAGMSPAETHKFIALINLKLRGNFTIVIVEHDMNVVMQTADTISVLASGSVLAEGRPDEIRAHGGVQEAYLGGAFAH